MSQLFAQWKMADVMDSCAPSVSLASEPDDAGEKLCGVCKVPVYMLVSLALENAWEVHSRGPLSRSSRR